MCAVADGAGGRDLDLVYAHDGNVGQESTLQAGRLHAIGQRSFIHIQKSH
jgi:hypothetical protein